MQEYKVKEKTAIVSPVSKLSGHPDRGLSPCWIKQKTIKLIFVSSLLSMQY